MKVTCSVCDRPGADLVWCDDMEVSRYHEEREAERKRRLAKLSDNASELDKSLVLAGYRLSDPPAYLSMAPTWKISHEDCVDRLIDKGEIQVTFYSKLPENDHEWFRFFFDHMLRDDQLDGDAVQLMKEIYDRRGRYKPV